MEWQIGKQINSAFSIAVEQPSGSGKAGKALGIEAATLGNGGAQQAGGLALNIRAHGVRASPTCHLNSQRLSHFNHP